jgi:hypothetical protein
MQIMVIKMSFKKLNFLKVLFYEVFLRFLVGMSRKNMLNLEESALQTSFSFKDFLVCFTNVYSNDMRLLQYISCDQYMCYTDVIRRMKILERTWTY